MLTVMNNKKVVPSAPPSLYRSISAGMIAWLRSKGIYISKAPSRSSKLPVSGKIPMVPGPRSMAVMLTWAAFLSLAVPARSEIKVLQGLQQLNAKINGMASLRRDERPPIFLHGPRRDSPSGNLKVAAILGASGLTGATLGAVVEPRILTNSKELLLESQAQKDLLSWERTPPRTMAKMLGFMSGGATAIAATLIDAHSGGGLKGFALGTASGSGFMAILGLTTSDGLGKAAWMRAGRHTLFGAAVSMISIGVSRGLVSVLY